MARYLFTTWEGGGHVQPMMLVASGLRARGHQVLLLSDACNAPEAALMNLPFRPWRHAPSRPDKTAASDLLRDWEADNPAEGIQRPLRADHRRSLGPLRPPTCSRRWKPRPSTPSSPRSCCLDR